LLTFAQTVNINLETVTNTTDTNFPMHFIGEDHAWDVDDFAKVGIVNLGLFLKAHFEDVRI
jgi:hypothetical protein